MGDGLGRLCRGSDRWSRPQRSPGALHRCVADGIRIDPLIATRRRAVFAVAARPRGAGVNAAMEWRLSAACGVCAALDAKDQRRKINLNGRRLSPSQPRLRCKSLIRFVELAASYGCLLRRLWCAPRTASPDDFASTYSRRKRASSCNWEARARKCAQPDRSKP